MKTKKSGMNIFKIFTDIFAHDKFIEKNKPSSLNSKIVLQLIIALGFFILSFANIIAKSNYMLVFTALGFVSNALFALLALKKHSRKLTAYSSIATCSVLFASFVICGGNDGFACLWVVLLPLMSMIIMDFRFGFIISVFFQIFLAVVFWTPVRELLLYDYNDQFCLRFPLFFLVTFLLGFLLAASLKQSEYNEYRHLLELEELSKKNFLLSRTDYLTKLANRRYSYEELNSRFSADNEKHCIVMGDIDDFKKVNDIYGHEFGDEVLIIISNYIKEQLPDDCLKSRWGGEEFLFAANDSLENVYMQVEKLRAVVSSHQFVFNATAFNITMTFGIAEYSDKDGISDAINLADQRLYIGKNNNKNCTVID